MNSSRIQLWSAPFVSAGVIQSHSLQRLRKGSGLGWVGTAKVEFLQLIISSGESVPRDFLASLVLLGCTAMAPPKSFISIITFSIGFKNTGLSINFLSQWQKHPWNSELSLALELNPGNLESLGCASREKKNSWERNFSFFWSQNGFARVLSDEGTVLSRGDMCIILTM